MGKGKTQGFPRGDLVSGFPLDDKFIELRGRLPPERFYAATGVYFHIAASMWREAERKPGERICPDATQAIEDLVSVALLDPQGRIPRRAFDNTVGRALSARKAAADRQAKKRGQTSQVVTRDTGERERESVRSGTERNPQELLGGTGGLLDDPNDDLHVAVAWLARHRAACAPTSQTGIALARLVDQWGAPKVVDAFEQLFADDESLRDPAQFVYGARKLLNPIPDVHRPSRPAAKGMSNAEDLAGAVERV